MKIVFTQYLLKMAKLTLSATRRQCAACCPLLWNQSTVLRTIEMSVPRATKPRVLQKTILLVEDEALVRMDTAASLREGGYLVQEAGNASDAINLLQSKPEIDLLFTDINLGKGMNGVELAEWALTQHPGMAVLVTTGGALITGLPPALGPILAKPYTAVELLKRARQAVVSDDGFSGS
jgi:CheY-like chemotaxis protein